MIHRDVSPQNVLRRADGAARVLDFWIAKAAGRAQITRDEQVKGKPGYSSPEQLRQNAGRGSDIYATGVCLWEALTMQRLFKGDNESAVLAQIMAGIAPPPSKHVPELPPGARRGGGARAAAPAEAALRHRARMSAGARGRHALGVARRGRRVGGAPVGPTLAGRADHIAALETEGATMRRSARGSGARPISAPAALEEALPESPPIAPVISEPASPAAPEPLRGGRGSREWLRRHARHRRAGHRASR